MKIDDMNVQYGAQAYLGMQLRELRGKTLQCVFAKKMNVSPARLSLWERGVHAVPFWVIIKYKLKVY